MLFQINIDSFIDKYVTGRTESLLKADIEKFHSDLNRLISGKNVLVIGGAGTIGSSYIKAVLKFNISKLIVVDINENGLTELVRDLRSAKGYHIPDEFITYPVNFGDVVFEKIFEKHGPFHIVANFAAHKHVRSEKDRFSIEAMIENNVFRTRKLIELLLKQPPERFFCVSTDKAANPVNIMGASKKLMEELLMAHADQLHITTARFANVAFSNGSLPLGFLERLNKRQPWSCPLGIRRYFISPRESGELCLIASILGSSGDIFFPKLDEEKDLISFDTIAGDLLRYLGFEPDICATDEEARQKALAIRVEEGRKLFEIKKWPVYFFQTETDGEKPFEEFYTKHEQPDMDSFINLGVIQNSAQPNLQTVNEIISDLDVLFKGNEITKSDIVKILNSYMPNFEHIETGKGLDSKM